MSCFPLNLLVEGSDLKLLWHGESSECKACDRVTKGHLVDAFPGLYGPQFVGYVVYSLSGTCLIVMGNCVVLSMCVEWWICQKVLS